MKLKINKIILFFCLLPCFLVCNTGTTNGQAIPVRKTQSSKTLRSMARVYMVYGEYINALRLADKALTAARKEKATDNEVAMCLIDLATVHKNLGNLKDAEELLEKAVQLQEDVLGNHPYLAYTLRILSSTYQEMGNEQQANICIGRSIAIMLEFHSADDKAMAPFYVDKAQLLTAQNRLGKAESYYQTAMDLVNKSYGQEHLYTAEVLVGIAKLYLLQERYTESEELINRATAIQERVYGADHYLIASNSAGLRVEGDNHYSETE